MIYGIGDVIYIRFRLQQQNIACITAAASRSTTLYTDHNTSAVYDNQLWIYENGFYYISTRYGRIGVHSPIRENDKCTYDMHTKTNERY